MATCAERAVILAHGGQFKKESWSEQAHTLEAAGFRVSAIDFRGYGHSHGPGDSDVLSAALYLDILGAAHYLQKHGAKTVTVVGGSLQGSADSPSRKNFTPEHSSSSLATTPMAMDHACRKFRRNRNRRHSQKT